MNRSGRPRRPISHERSGAHEPHQGMPPLIDRARASAAGRNVAAVVVLAAPLAACGGGSHSAGGSLDTLMKRPGPDVSVIPGAADYQPGVVRFPFLVLRPDLGPVVRGTA